MAVDIVVPVVGESVKEGVIARWLKAPGDALALDEPVVEVETDKVTVEVPAPEAGVLVAQMAAVGETVAIGAVIGRIEVGPATAAAAQTHAPTKAPKPEVVIAAPQVPAPKPDAPATALRLPPSKRRHLFENGEAPSTPAPSSAPAPTPPPPSPADPGLAPDEDVVPMSPLRKRIAARLVAAQRESASLTTFNEIDMHAVLTLRERHQDAFVKRHGVKLGFMSFFTKAVVGALAEYPGLNAEVRGETIVYKKHYDIGIAVGSGRGLVVPVIRGAQALSIPEIERIIADFGARARDNKLTLDDLTGGTFSITNGGVYGSMLSTPLLNYPQTGILGMHNIVRRPTVVGDAIEIRPIMMVALTYDHRVVDGREAVQFLVAVKQRVEAPERMLLGV
jgi:2-oxoglutarate dehydrogenase E2 component (dihydrolipoamide succinyltransferase)